jgi:hypothetical protein
MNAAAKVRLRSRPGDWGPAGRSEALKREILALPSDSLPLQLAVTHGGVVLGGVEDATVLSIEPQGTSLTARVGIFFTETVGGCSCGEDPFTADGYCELCIRMDEGSVEAEIRLI